MGHSIADVVSQMVHSQSGKQGQFLKGPKSITLHFIPICLGKDVGKAGACSFPYRKSAGADPNRPAAVNLSYPRLAQSYPDHLQLLASYLPQRTYCKPA
jgi:hypothetical protein